MTYAPYRMLSQVTVTGPDPKKLRRDYPHASRYMTGTGRRSHTAVFVPGIINAPTAAEMLLFDNLPDTLVMMIPQDKRGFDRRDSGVARSIPTSIKGRAAGVMEAHKRKVEEARAKPAPAPVPAPQPKLRQEPEQEVKQEPEPKAPAIAAVQPAPVPDPEPEPPPESIPDDEKPEKVPKRRRKRITATPTSFQTEDAGSAGTTQRRSRKKPPGQKKEQERKEP